MTRRVYLFAICLICSRTGSVAGDHVAFEDAVRMSDRIVVGTVEGAGAGMARVGDTEVMLGIKDDATGLVFTPYRIRIDLCVFDKDDSCAPGDSEVLIPGGTVYETIGGQRRLRTWEIAGAAGAPLPSAGGEVLLFMIRRNGKYTPLNDAGGRIRVDQTAGKATVVLRFASPRFMSDGRESAVVEIDRLKEMVSLIRPVPKPTSGMRHAAPVRAADNGIDVVSRCRLRVCAG